jgi:hypothetical protein
MCLGQMCWPTTKLFEFNEVDVNGFGQFFKLLMKYCSYKGKSVRNSNLGDGNMAKKVGYFKGARG